MPGLAEHARGFKSLLGGDRAAQPARAHLEIAETIDDVERAQAVPHVRLRRRRLRRAGGLAELQDFAADVLDLYPRCRVRACASSSSRRRDRVMPEISEGLAQFAMRELRARGMEFRIETTLERVTATAATLSDGEVVPTRTLVWTAGVKPHPVVAKLGLPLERPRPDRGRRVPAGRRATTTSGRSATPPRSRTPRRSSGHSVAADRAARGPPGPDGRAQRRGGLGAGKRKPLHLQDARRVRRHGPRHEAVAETLGIRWRGRPAWFLARTYHLAHDAGLRRRARLLTDWTVGLLFGRDPPSWVCTPGGSSASDDV